MAIGTYARTIAAAFIILVSAASAAATGTTDAAQNATARAHGSIGGWQIHSVGEAIMIVSPDRRFATVGRLYSASGADIGAALTGRPPRPMDPATVQALSTLLQGGGGRVAYSNTERADQECTDEEYAQSCSASPDVLPDIANIMPSTGLPSAPGGVAEALAAVDRTAEVIEQLEAAWGHTVGFGGPRVTMVLDPECPYCGAALAAMRPALEAGTTHLRMVPVAVVSQRSGITLASLLSAEAPGAALYDFMLAKAADNTVRPPRLRVEGVTPEMRQGVADNITLMRSLDIRQVPYFAWRDEAGQARALSGVPAS
ncbi:MAG: hypothetical protein OXE86_13870, partial [Alphaproteobacteria bacterium]|nr:hypothetical protein [Alphaproteobacteria bacterium]